MLFPGVSTKPMGFLLSYVQLIGVNPTKQDDIVDVESLFELSKDKVTQLAIERRYA